MYSHSRFIFSASANVTCRISTRRSFSRDSLLTSSSLPPPDHPCLASPPSFTFHFSAAPARTAAPRAGLNAAASNGMAPRAAGTAPCASSATSGTPSASPKNTPKQISALQASTEPRKNDLNRVMIMERVGKPTPPVRVTLYGLASNVHPFQWFCVPSEGWMSFCPVGFLYILFRLRTWKSAMDRLLFSFN